MKTFNAEHARHKAKMYLVLEALISEPELQQIIAFKGGTCAAMLGLLDRFSVDLDFDLLKPELKTDLRPLLEGIFTELGFNVKDQSKNAWQYFLKYDAQANERNTLKVEITDLLNKNNIYENYYLPDLKRFVKCQSKETMFANKLVALTNRSVNRPGKIAARDLYDIYKFFSLGLGFNEAVITERTGKTASEYFTYLADFIEREFTQKLIDEELNTLLPYENFRKIRKVIKSEVIFLLRAG